ncbi:MAG: recombination protein RecR [Chloroflexi bacterium]|nr:recombination protein RecR [Chloroflexota bacterium]
MDYLPAAAPIVRLIEELNKLPGVGPKTAQRLAYHLIRTPAEEVSSLAQAIAAIKEQVVFCSQCQNITDINPCVICTDARRDAAQICVVEQPLDVLALEKTHIFKGMYHVLHGAISPINGVGPGDLKVQELVDRIAKGGVDEIILATNPSLEGEATATYVQRQIGGTMVRITRLARGLPAGIDLEYADEVTLSRALAGRQEFD